MNVRNFAVWAGAVTLGAAVILPTLPSSAGPARQSAAHARQTLSGPDGPNNSTVVKTFHSNLNAGTTVKISSHGNVVSYLSPDSAGNGHYEHIGVGALSEGYVLCYTGPTGTLNRFDTGSNETGFGPATVVASPFKVTRTTADGKIQFVQTYVFTGQERSIQINMTVKNVSASPINNVVLRRQVDFDVDTGGTDGFAGFQNYHANTTHTSAFAFNRAADAPPGKEAHSMVLAHVGPSPVSTHFAFVTTNILETSCDGTPHENGTPTAVAFGDFGDTILYQMNTVPAGGSKQANIEYFRQ